MLSPQEWHNQFIHQARWTQRIRYFISKQIQLNHAKRILEAGCGTGVITTELQSYTSAIIHGVDIRQDFIILAQLNSSSQYFTCGDVFFLPYPINTFDISFCHFFLLWLVDPVKGIAEMCRVTKPGGYIVALAEPDYNGRIDYPPPLEELGRIQGEALKYQGADPYIGRRLAKIFVDSNLQNVQIGLLGGHWSGPPSSKAWDSEWSVIEDDLNGFITPEELIAMRNLDLDSWERGIRILYVPTFYAWGLVP